MNKFRHIGAFCAAMFMFITTSSQAALISVLGGQAAYDTVLDITWVTAADLSGSDTWDNQVAWASGLDYLGFDDWRLASMSVAAGLPTGTAPTLVDCNSASEELCRDNELGYMYYQNLSGTLLDNLQGNQTVGDVTLTNIQQFYWSGTDKVLIAEDPPANAWNIGFGTGIQGNSGKAGSNYGWAVRDGGSNLVPVPPAVWLFGSGLLGLIGVARRQRR